MGFFDDLVSKRMKPARIARCPVCNRQFTVFGKERNCRYEDCIRQRAELVKAAAARRRWKKKVGRT